MTVDIAQFNDHGVGVDADGQRGSNVMGHSRLESGHTIREHGTIHRDDPQDAAPDGARYGDARLDPVVVDIDVNCGLGVRLVRDSYGRQRKPEL